MRANDLSTRKVPALLLLLSSLEVGSLWLLFVEGETPYVGHYIVIRLLPRVAPYPLPVQHTNSDLTTIAFRSCKPPETPFRFQVQSYCSTVVLTVAVAQVRSKHLWMYGALIFLRSLPVIAGPPFKNSSFAVVLHFSGTVARKGYINDCRLENRLSSTKQGFTVADLVF